MHGSQGALLLLLVIPLFIGILWLKAKWGRKAIEKRLQAEGMEAEIISMGIPPFRLWFKNRKGDTWGKLRFPDGTEKWARIRDRLFSDSSFDLYD